MWRFNVHFPYVTVALACFLRMLRQWHTLREHTPLTDKQQITTREYYCVWVVIKNTSTSTHLSAKRSDVVTHNHNHRHKNIMYEHHSVYATCGIPTSFRFDCDFLLRCHAVVNRYDYNCQTTHPFRFCLVAQRCLRLRLWLNYIWIMRAVVIQNK